MKKIYSIIICVLLINTGNGISQIVPRILDQDNQKIKEIAQNVDKAGWVYLKSEKKLKSDDVFDKYKDAFGLTVNDEMIKVRTQKDELGMTHIKYQQYYKGIPVEHFTYLIHDRNGVAEIANGEVLENLDLNVKPLISNEEAFKLAVNSFDSKKWAWENSDSENDSFEADLSSKPNGELLIIDKLIDEKKTGVLVYKFDLMSREPYFHYAIYVNAISGNIEKNVSLSREAEGTVYTLYNGTQTFNTLYRGTPNWDYILKDETRGIICTKMYSEWSWDLTAHIDNHENLWHNSGNEVNGATAQWCAEETYDYFHEKFNRHGIDNDDLELRVELDPYFVGAEWCGEGADHDLLHLGLINNNYSATLDIVGHEYTHGVISCEANLVYEKEPGALNESFADIFGTMVEKNIESSTWNWTIGEDVYTNDYLRSMSNPHAKYQPSIYLSDGYWIDVTNCTPTGGQDGNDYCGVHTNSGVQNYWFYMLSHGDTQNGITVTGIGENVAALIAYWNLKYYLTEQSGYLAARNGSILSAAVLYGQCSNQCIQTTNAWAAVGVGEPADPCMNCLISGPTYVVSGDTVNWYSNVSGGSGYYTCLWRIYSYVLSEENNLTWSYDAEETTYLPLTLVVTDLNGIYRDSDEISVCFFPHEEEKSSENSTFIVEAYPNPASNIVTIKILDKPESTALKEEDDYLINIIDKMGRLLFQKKTRISTFDISTSSFIDGTYPIIVKKGNIVFGTTLLIRK